MFFFKKKQRPDYKIFLHSVHKFRWIANELKSARPEELVILIYFFEESRENMRKLLNAAGISFENSSGNSLLTNGIHLMDARSFEGKHLPKADQVTVLEVHPMKSINEIPLIAGQENKVTDMVYYTGLDEGVMKVFGGERLQHLMTRMGAEEDQPIEHSMVNKSIDRATEKAEKETKSHEDVRSSQDDWLSANQM